MKVFYFQDPTYSTDFGTSRARTVFHLLEMPVGSHYPKVFRILVPSEILVPLEISAQFEEYSLYKKGFSIYDQVTIWNFPEKRAQNKYICVGS